MLSSMKDTFFKEKRDEVIPFEFTEEVAEVFDDMVKRSVPNYDEIHRVIIDITRRHYTQGTVCDLGCSTGTTLKLIHKTLLSEKKELPKLIGVDNSPSMIKKAKNKLRNLNSVSLKESDIENFILPKDSGMIIMNYTLQFLPKENRQECLKNIFNSLLPGGVFILAEKILCHSERVNDLITNLYYDFKRRNGYSELEISQKREALENFLVPITPSEQLNSLKDAGFKDPELIFRWYNFCCYLCLK